MYPFYIMSALRQCDDLDPNDTSHDEMFMKLPKRSVIKWFLEWNGIIHYTDRIIDLIQDVYEVNLED